MTEFIMYFNDNLFCSAASFSLRGCRVPTPSKVHFTAKLLIVFVFSEKGNKYDSLNIVDHVQNMIEYFQSQPQPLNFPPSARLLETTDIIRRTLQVGSEKNLKTMDDCHQEQARFGRTAGKKHVVLLESLLKIV